ncbi:MAG: hypothetical protein EOP56_15130 [Sphingobacteriales bacterium]|nr:MAG: hypothetical protein EOP56_15130 [Sphingobacteriales bacterium]
MISVELTITVLWQGVQPRESVAKQVPLVTASISDFTPRNTLLSEKYGKAVRAIFPIDLSMRSPQRLAVNDEQRRRMLAMERRLKITLTYQLLDRRDSIDDYIPEINAEQMNLEKEEAVCFNCINAVTTLILRMQVKPPPLNSPAFHPGTGDIILINTIKK